MKTGLAAVAAIAASFALVGIFVVAAPALASPQSNMTSSSNRTMSSNASDTMTSGLMGDRMSMSWLNDTSKKFGVISSIQNGEDGEPAWVVAGHWVMTNDTTASSNETGGSTIITDFHAGFYMTMLDGSAQHTHEISNFTQDGNSTTEGNMTTVRGTATVTMREGPVHGVETEITISQGNVIAISLDQEATDSHFGNTPIYGMTITPEIIQHAKEKMMNMTTNSMIQR